MAEDNAVTLKVHPDPSGKKESEEEIRRTPGNASLVDKSQWENQRAATVKDLTDYIPGVITQPRNGAESSRLSVRGSGLANIFQGRGLLLLQDGIPINMSDGSFEFPLIDPWLTQYAEVYPGANALQYGASSFGGAINFITPTGRDSQGYEFRAEGGSFGTLHTQLSTGQQFGSTDAFFAASDFRQKGFRDNNEQNTTRLNGNLGWQINENLSNRFYISQTNARSEIPGTISKAAIRDYPSQANVNNRIRHFQRDLNITRIANKLNWQSGSDQMEATVFYTDRELDNPVTTYEFEDSQDYGVQAKYTKDIGLDRLTTGANIYYGTADEIRYQNVFASPGAFILSRDLQAVTSEAFAQYDRHLTGRLYGIGGFQGSYATRDIEQNAPAPSTQTKEYFGFNPRIGLRYEIDPVTQLFTNISRSFEPPTWGELSGGNSPGFNDLKAQKATTFEIGGKGLYRGWNWSAAYYHGWLKNEFVNYRFEDGSSDTINVSKSKRDGIELGLSGDVLSNAIAYNDVVGLRMAYSFNHFTLDDDELYGNNMLPGVAEHFIRSELIYRHPSGLAFGPNIEWVPRASPVDLTNSFETDDYAILGARAFWEKPDQGINFYIEGRNLLDKDYIATNNVVPDAGGADGNFFYPGEGRAVYIGLKIKL